MSLKYIQLLKEDGTWDDFQKDWEGQCKKFDEDFADFASGTFSVVGELVENKQRKAGVFAFCNRDTHISMCQINVAGLPKYDSPVMRVRFLTLCPDFDFGENTIEEYATALVAAFAGILALSNTEGDYGVNHINFHLKSPADRSFFSALGKGLNESDDFKSVQTVGSWLYITKL